MKKNIIIYGSYLAILGLITLSILFMGVPNRVGLWAALGVAAVYAVFWPRWG